MKMNAKDATAALGGIVLILLLATVIALISVVVGGAIGAAITLAYNNLLGAGVSVHLGAVIGSISSLFSSSAHISAEA